MAQRRGIFLLTTTGACLAALLITGCSAETQQWILSTFFDGADTPPPPTHRVRRDLLREIEELKQQAAEARRELAEGLAAKSAKEGSEQGRPPVEKAKGWEETSELLPKTKAGNINWSQALKSRAVAPQPGIDRATPDQAALDLDIEFPSLQNKLYAATFSHAEHTRWLTCGNCHPAIFPLGRGSPPVKMTMANLRAGQYCGACHGKVAFGWKGECVQCHKKPPATPESRPPEEPRRPVEKARSWDEAAKLIPVTGGMPDWTKALADGIIAPRPGIDPKATDQPVFPMTVERVPAGQPAMKALFPHEAHTQWLGCDNCHPAVFQMKTGATQINMGLIYAGQSCGACHGTVAFAATACDRCHPAMAGGK